MNAARALFMSDYQAYTGISLELVGRNFDQSEFGGITAAQLQLNNGSGGVYTQTITSLNPYNVTFTVGTVPVGTYFVEVSNDSGINWARLSNGQTLSIVATPGGTPDPLGLGVTWARDFNWTNVVNVTTDLVRLGIYSSNINASDTAGDDKTPIQNAIKYVESHGGGVVYFPNGNYYTSQIHMSPTVVLQGQDEYNTKIYYNGTGGWSFISSYSDNYAGNAQPTMQLQGLARLSILMSSDKVRPDVIINMGDNNVSGAGSDETVRLANRIFFSQINLNYGYTSGSSSPSFDINDTDAGITYTGTSWTTVGSLHTTTHVGDSFQYTFTGSSIGYHTGQTGGANYTVYLDGVALATNVTYSDCWANTTTYGTHTLMVKYTGASGQTMALNTLTVLTPRGLGMLWTGKERVLMQNNNLVGWSATNTGTYVTQYCIIRNNYFEYSNGYVHDTANYAFFESNTVIIHPEYNQDSHGLFGRSDTYFYNNYVQGAGDGSNVQNDGEAIATEMPGGAFNFGTGTSATATSITVIPTVTLVNPTVQYGDLSIMITNGRGLGQLR